MKFCNKCPNREPHKHKYTLNGHNQVISSVRLSFAFALLCDCVDVYTSSHRFNDDLCVCVCVFACMRVQVSFFSFFFFGFQRYCCYVIYLPRCYGHTVNKASAADFDFYFCSFDLIADFTICIQIRVVLKTTHKTIFTR